MLDWPHEEEGKQCQFQNPCNLRILQNLSSFSKTSGLCGYRGHNCNVDETALHEGTTAIIGTKKKKTIISKFYEMRYKT